MDSEKTQNKAFLVVVKWGLCLGDKNEGVVEYNVCGK